MKEVHLWLKDGELSCVTHTHISFTVFFSVGERSSICIFCNEVYSQTYIDPHQVTITPLLQTVHPLSFSFMSFPLSLISQALCEKNPDKPLKTAYKSHLTAQSSKNPTPTALQSRSLSPAVSQPSPLPQAPPPSPKPTPNNTGIYVYSLSVYLQAHACGLYIPCTPGLVALILVY